jgi:ABC-type antimicrobial peptide transport system permease subunit
MAARIHGLDLNDGGKWFSIAGVREVPTAKGDAAADQDAAGKSSAPKSESAIEAVLGEGIARLLARDRTEAETAAARNPVRLDVGDRFEAGARRWIVVGVTRSSGSTFDSEVWAKREVVARQYGKETYTSLLLRATDADAAEKLKDHINNNYKKASLLAQVETTYFASLGETSKQFLGAIMIVTGVMAVGGVFGVMNTMFAAISQRTKDLGVLRLLGYARWQILTSFLLESLVIALVGGALGCALGSLSSGWTATSIVGSGQGGGKSVILKLIVDADTIAAGMLLTLAMGGLGGLVPALSAMRLKPLDALR